MSLTQLTNACTFAIGVKSDRDRDIAALAVRHAMQHFPCAVTCGEVDRVRKDWKSKRAATVAAVQAHYGVGLITGFLLSLAIKWIVGRVFAWLWDQWGSREGRGRICAAAVSVQTGGFGPM